MSGIADDAYLRTRLAIMSANLLGADRIAELADLPADQIDAATGFDVIEADRPGESLAMYERAMMQTWLDELSALLRPLGGPARRLLTHWASRYELLNIKALVRGKLHQLSNEEIEHNLFSLPSFLSLDHNALLNTDSVPDLLRRLQKTRYRSLATQALRSYEERPDPFFLDATLDQQFYSDLIHRAQLLTGDDRTETINLVGRIVDRHNLVWTLRYRFNYRLEPSEILYLAIDGGRVLNRARLQSILQADSVEEAVTALPDNLLAHGDMPNSIIGIEIMMRNDLLEYVRRAMRRSPSAVTSVLAYLVLRHSEMKSMYAIVHARVHHISNQLLHDAMDPLREEVA